MDTMHDMTHIKIFLRYLVKIANYNIVLYLVHIFSEILWIVQSKVYTIDTNVHVYQGSIDGAVNWIN